MPALSQGHTWELCPSDGFDNTMQTPAHTHTTHHLAQAVLPVPSPTAVYVPAPHLMHAF